MKKTSLKRSFTALFTTFMLLFSSTLFSDVAPSPIAATQFLNELRAMGALNQETRNEVIQNFSHDNSPAAKELRLASLATESFRECFQEAKTQKELGDSLFSILSPKAPDCNCSLSESELASSPLNVTSLANITRAIAKSDAQIPISEEERVKNLKEKLYRKLREELAIGYFAAKAELGIDFSMLPSGPSKNSPEKVTPKTTAKEELLKLGPFSFNEKSDQELIKKIETTLARTPKKEVQEERVKALFDKTNNDLKEIYNLNQQIAAVESSVANKNAAINQFFIKERDRKKELRRAKGLPPTRGHSGLGYDADEAFEWKRQNGETTERMASKNLDIVEAPMRAAAARHTTEISENLRLSEELLNEADKEKVLMLRKELIPFQTRISKLKEIKEKKQSSVKNSMVMRGAINYQSSEAEKIINEGKPTPLSLYNSKKYLTYYGLANRHLLEEFYRWSKSKDPSDFISSVIQVDPSYLTKFLEEDPTLAPLLCTLSKKEIKAKKRKEEIKEVAEIAAMGTLVVVTGGTAAIGGLALAGTVLTAGGLAVGVATTGALTLEAIEKNHETRLLTSYLASKGVGSFEEINAAVTETKKKLLYAAISGALTAVDYLGFLKALKAAKSLKEIRTLGEVKKAETIFGKGEGVSTETFTKFKNDIADGVNLTPQETSYLSDAQRIEAGLLMVEKRAGRALTETEKDRVGKAIIEAHNIPRTNISEKARTLQKAGVGQQSKRDLMLSGVTGKWEQTIPLPNVNNLTFDTPFALPKAMGLENPIGTVTFSKRAFKDLKGATDKTKRYLASLERGVVTDGNGIKKLTGSKTAYEVRNLGTEERLWGCIEEGGVLVLRGLTNHQNLSEAIKACP